MRIKVLLFKILMTPFFSFFAMMFTAAFLGREILREEPFNNSGLLLFYGWMILSIISVIIHHFIPKRKRLDI